jgi:ankyrin repeat protein
VTDVDWERAGWAPLPVERDDGPRPSLLQIWWPVVLVGLAGTLVAVTVVFVPIWFFNREVGSLVHEGTRQCDDPANGGLRFDAGSGDVDAVQGDLDAGRTDIDGSADGWTPLLCAAENGEVAAAATLLDAGADPDLAVGGRASPLAIAAGAGNAELIELLLKEGADPNSGFGGTTPLIESAENDQAALIPVLVAGGADPDAMNDRGVTPLVSAAGHPDAIEALLAAGADANAPADIDGQTILVSWSIWRLPLSSGAHDPLTHGRGPSTALHAAVLAGDAESVRLLLDAGAEPNAVAYGAFTPLHIATLNGDEALVDALVAAGADPHLAPDPEVGNPEDLATAPPDEPGQGIPLDDP